MLLETAVMHVDCIRFCGALLTGVAQHDGNHVRGRAKALEARPAAMTNGMEVQVGETGFPLYGRGDVAEREALAAEHVLAPAGWCAWRSGGDLPQLLQELNGERRDRDVQRPPLSRQPRHPTLPVLSGDVPIRGGTVDVEARPPCRVGLPLPRPVQEDDAGVGRPGQRQGIQPQPEEGKFLIGEMALPSAPNCRAHRGQLVLKPTRGITVHPRPGHPAPIRRRDEDLLVLAPSKRGPEQEEDPPCLCGCLPRERSQEAPHVVLHDLSSRHKPQQALGDMAAQLGVVRPPRFRCERPHLDVLLHQAGDRPFVRPGLGVDLLGQRLRASGASVPRGVGPASDLPSTQQRRLPCILEAQGQRVADVDPAPPVALRGGQQVEGASAASGHAQREAPGGVTARVEVDSPLSSAFDLQRLYEPWRQVNLGHARPPRLQRVPPRATPGQQWSREKMSEKVDGSGKRTYHQAAVNNGVHRETWPMMLTSRRVSRELSRFILLAAL